MGLPAPGAIPQAAGGQPQFNNALAQMLAGLGPQYQPGDTRWGLPGDRLLRFTPQTGNQGMTFGGAGGGGGLLGKGGTPPGPGGGSSGTLPNGTTVNTPGLPGGSNVNINWGNLQSAMNQGQEPGVSSPAFAASTSKLQPGASPSGPMPPQDQLLARENQTRAAVRSIMDQKPDSYPGGKAAWYAALTAAQNAYVQAQKDTGMSAGAPTWSPFAPGQVGAIGP
jgi:hypothetical protein